MEDSRELILKELKKLIDAMPEDARKSFLIKAKKDLIKLEKTFKIKFKEDGYEK